MEQGQRAVSRERSEVKIKEEPSEESSSSRLPPIPATDQPAAKKAKKPKAHGTKPASKKSRQDTHTASEKTLIPEISTTSQQFVNDILGLGVSEKKFRNDGEAKAKGLGKRAQDILDEVQPLWEKYRTYRNTNVGSAIPCTELDLIDFAIRRVCRFDTSAKACVGVDQEPLASYVEKLLRPALKELGIKEKEVDWSEDDEVFDVRDQLVDFRQKAAHQLDREDLVKAIEACESTVRRLRDTSFKILLRHPFIISAGEHIKQRILYALAALYNDKIRIRALYLHGINPQLLRDKGFDDDEIAEACSLPAHKEFSRTKDADASALKLGYQCPIGSGLYSFSDEDDKNEDKDNDREDGEEIDELWESQKENNAPENGEAEDDETEDDSEASNDDEGGQDRGKTGRGSPDRESKQDALSRPPSSTGSYRNAPEAEDFATVQSRSASDTNTRPVSAQRGENGFGQSREEKTNIIKKPHPNDALPPAEKPPVSKAILPVPTSRDVRSSQISKAPYILDEPPESKRTVPSKYGETLSKAEYEAAWQRIKPYMLPWEQVSAWCKGEKIDGVPAWSKTVVMIENRSEVFELVHYKYQTAPEDDPKLRDQAASIFVAFLRSKATQIQKGEVPKFLRPYGWSLSIQRNQPSPSSQTTAGSSRPVTAVESVTDRKSNGSHTNKQDGGLRENHNGGSKAEEEMNDEILHSETARQRNGEENVSETQNAAPFPEAEQQRDGEDSVSHTNAEPHPPEAADQKDGEDDAFRTNNAVQSPTVMHQRDDEVNVSRASVEAHTSAASQQRNGEVDVSQPDGQRSIISQDGEIVAAESSAHDGFADGRNHPSAMEQPVKAQSEHADGFAKSYDTDTEPLDVNDPLNGESLEDDRMLPTEQNTDLTTHEDGHDSPFYGDEGFEDGTESQDGEAMHTTHGPNAVTQNSADNEEADRSTEIDMSTEEDVLKDSTEDGEFRSNGTAPPESPVRETGESLQAQNIPQDAAHPRVDEDTMSENLTNGEVARYRLNPTITEDNVGSPQVGEVPMQEAGTELHSREGEQEPTLSPVRAGIQDDDIRVFENEAQLAATGEVEDPTLFSSPPESPSQLSARQDSEIANIAAMNEDASTLPFGENEPQIHSQEVTSRLQHGEVTTPNQVLHDGVSRSHDEVGAANASLAPNGEAQTAPDSEHNLPTPLHGESQPSEATAPNTDSHINGEEPPAGIPNPPAQVPKKRSWYEMIRGWGSW